MRIDARHDSLGDFEIPIGMSNDVPSHAGHNAAPLSVEGATGVSQGATDISQASILIVDSDAESLYSIASILIASQHRVTTARNASVAIELAKHQLLDLVIADTQLGDTRGEGLMDLIRQCPNKSDVPALFVSATQTPGVIYRTADNGGSGFHLKKPIDQALLIEMVGRALWLPHLVSSHIEQKIVTAPHVSFARNPMAIPEFTMAGFTSTPVSF